MFFIELDVGFVSMNVFGPKLQVVNVKTEARQKIDGNWLLKRPQCLKL